MFTGVNPGKHGIVDFLLKEKNGFVPCLSRYRMCETIFQILSKSGLKCVVINDPVTYPPEEVNGLMTTGLMTPPGSTNWIYPKQLKNEINLVARGYEPDIPSNFSSLVREDRKKAATIINELATKVHRVGRYAATRFEWDLLAIIFTTTDRLQHYWWDDHDEITKHYRMLDEMIGDYMKIADDFSADIIIVSDHGFGPVKHIFQIDKWLQDSGLAHYRHTRFSKAMSRINLTKDKIPKLLPNWHSIFDILPDFLQTELRRFIPEGHKVADISRSDAYCIGSGVFVKGEKKEKVAKSLRELTDEAGVPILEEVIDRENALHGPYSDRGSDLFIQPRSDYFVSRSFDEFNGVLLGDDSQRILTGHHRPDGIFIHYGPNNSLYAPASINLRPWDVAALILHLLGVPLPEYFDGEPPHNIDYA